MYIKMYIKMYFTLKQLFFMALFDLYELLATQKLSKSVDINYLPITSLNDPGAYIPIFTILRILRFFLIFLKNILVQNMHKMLGIYKEDGIT